MKKPCSYYYTQEGVYQIALRGLILLHQGYHHQTARKQTDGKQETVQMNGKMPQLQVGRHAPGDISKRGCHP